MKHTRKSLRTLGATLVASGTLSLFSLPSQAAVVIGNMPANDEASTSINSSTFQKAMVFTMGNQAFTVDNVVLRLSSYNTATDVARLGFFLDVGGGSNTGSQEGSFLQAPVSASDDAGDFTFTPAGSLTLAANTRYWLLLDASAGDFLWRASNPAVSPVGSGAAFDFGRFSTTNGATYTNSTFLNSFQINGTVVPEPSSALLFGLGTIGLAVRRRRIR